MPKVTADTVAGTENACETVLAPGPKEPSSSAAPLLMWNVDVVSTPLVGLFESVQLSKFDEKSTFCSTRQAAGAQVPEPSHVSDPQAPAPAPQTVPCGSSFASHT